jgi:hypothetical protein
VSPKPDALVGLAAIANASIGVMLALTLFQAGNWLLCAASAAVTPDAVAVDTPAALSAATIWAGV